MSIMQERLLERFGANAPTLPPRTLFQTTDELGSDPSWGDLFGAAWDVVNPLPAAADFIAGASNTPSSLMYEEPGYNFLKDPRWKPEYARFGDYFSDVYNPHAFSYKLSRIEEEYKNQDTLARGGAASYVAMIGAGLLDPLNLIPFAGLRHVVKGGNVLARAGAGAGRGALVVGSQGAASAALSEMIVANERVLSDERDVALAALIGGSLTAAFGAGGGAWRAIADESASMSGARKIKDPVLQNEVKRNMGAGVVNDPLSGLDPDELKNLSEAARAEKIQKFIRSENGGRLQDAPIGGWFKREVIDRFASIWDMSVRIQTSASKTAANMFRVQVNGGPLSKVAAGFSTVHGQIKVRQARAHEHVRNFVGMYHEYGEAMLKAGEKPRTFDEFSEMFGGGRFEMRTTEVEGRVGLTGEFSARFSPSKAEKSWFMSNLDKVDDFWEEYLQDSLAAGVITGRQVDRAREMGPSYFMRRLSNQKIAQNRDAFRQDILMDELGMSKDAADRFIDSMGAGNDAIAFGQAMRMSSDSFETISFDVPNSKLLPYLDTDYVSGVKAMAMDMGAQIEMVKAMRVNNASFKAMDLYDAARAKIDEAQRAGDMDLFEEAWDDILDMEVGRSLSNWLDEGVDDVLYRYYENRREIRSLTQQKKKLIRQKREIEKRELGDMRKMSKEERRQLRELLAEVDDEYGKIVLGLHETAKKLSQFSDVMDEVKTRVREMHAMEGRHIPHVSGKKYTDLFSNRKRGRPEGMKTEKEWSRAADVAMQVLDDIVKRTSADALTQTPYLRKVARELNIHEQELIKKRMSRVREGDPTKPQEEVSFFDKYAKRPLGSVKDKFADMVYRNPRSVIDDLRTIRDDLLSRVSRQRDADVHQMFRMQQRLRTVMATTKLGYTAIASLADLGIIAMNQGFMRPFAVTMQLWKENGYLKTLGQAIMPSTGQGAGMGRWNRLQRKLKSNSGEILNQTQLRDEVSRLVAAMESSIHDSRFHAFHEMPGIGSSVTNVDRALDRTSGAFSELSYANKHNSFWSQVAATVSQGRLTSHIMKLVDAENPVEFLAKNPLIERDLRQAGIDVDLARRFYESINEHAEWSGAITRVNSHLWEDQVLANQWRSMIMEEAQRNVLRRSPGDGPRSQYWPVISLVHAFKSYSFAAYNKVFQPMLQRPEAHRYAGAMFAVFIGSQIYRLREYLAGREPSDDIRVLMREGIDRAGIAGYLTDINLMAEILTDGYVGATRLGLPSSRGVASNTWTEKGIELMGPAIGTLNDAASILGTTMGAFGGRAPTESDIDAIKRTLPFNNFFGVDWATRDLNEWVKENFASELEQIEPK